MADKLENQIRRMEYPVLTGTFNSVREFESPADALNRVRALESKLDDQERQFARELDTVRREALEKGKQLAGSEHNTWRQECAAQLHTAIDESRSRIDEYIARVEHEVVRLALAVAERILHREAQLDPLLLSGSVRVALGQLAESTEVRLRVPAEQADMWAEMVRLMPGLPLRPEILADPEMQPCEAALETKVGAVDLSVRAQLEEIDRGFFDLIEAGGDTKDASPHAAGKQE